ncbi:hypothetical protein, partial [Escherichia coli]|uniref:hypothetical protein n=1 Tax=Escherichia coli TaxID=562 RepID=UPI0028E04B70
MVPKHHARAVLPPPVIRYPPVSLIPATASGNAGTRAKTREKDTAMKKWFALCLLAIWPGLAMAFVPVEGK